MIKRLSFANRAPDVAAATFAEAWTQAWTQAWAAQAEASGAPRPDRVVVCTTVPDLAGPDVRHDGVVIEWFADDDHLRDHDAWLAAATPAPADRPGHLVMGGPVVVVDEVVLRGADWLAQRWLDGGPRFKHMALAQRAVGLTPAEFSDRWRHHAGRVGPATVIPDDVRGQAYVQDHPRPRPEQDWAYDAVNEVYFDDLDGLGRRIRWFEDNRVGTQPDQLTQASWFLPVREVIVHPSL